MSTERKVSPIGLLFLFVGTAVTGAILSFIYLWVNRMSLPIDWLYVLAAVGVGALMGLVSRMIIRLFKIKALAPALIAVIIACLGFTYFKWALFVATDSSSDFSVNYTYWYAICFDEDFTDDNGVLYSSAKLTDIVTDMKNMSAYDYLIAYGQDDLWELKTWPKEELQVLMNESFFSYMEHDLYLSSGSVRDVVQVIQEEYNYSYYDYYVYLLEHGGFPTASYYMMNPGVLFDTIVKINAEGRWSYGETAVYGALLWIVWVIEFFVICIFAIIAVPKAIKSLEPPQAVSALEGMRLNPDNPAPPNNTSAPPSTANWTSDGFGGTAELEKVDDFGRPMSIVEEPVSAVGEISVPVTSAVIPDSFGGGEEYDEYGRPIAQPDEFGR